ncbi:MAG: DUF4168 domain-containing protein [Cyanobacteria bacterium P01_F01_bin.4]
MSRTRIFADLYQGFLQGIKGCLVGWLVVLLWCAPGWAAELPMDKVPVTAPITQTADIPSEKINQFANAYIQVVTLINERGRELQQAETEAESLQIEQSIQTEAFRLMRDNDLQVAEYLQLLGLANQDADFRDRILAEIEEANPA